MSRYISKTILLISLVFLSTTISWGQTARDAARLHDEGQDIYEKASSRADTEKALQKVEQALAIFRRLRERKGEANCLNRIGLIYNSWGQYVHPQ